MLIFLLIMHLNFNNVRGNLRPSNLSVSFTRIAGVVKRFYNSYTGFERDAKLLIISGAISSISYGFLDVTYAPYMDIIGLGGALIGTLMLVSMLSSAILMIPFGILADRYGRKPFVLVNVLLSTLSFGIYFFVTDVVTFALAELIRGIGWAMAWGTSGALLAEKTSEKQRPYAFGLSSFGFSVGAVIGYLMGAVPDFLTMVYGMSNIQSIRIMYLVTAFVTLSAIFPLIPIKEEKRTLEKTKGKRLNITSWRILAWFVLTNGLIGLGAGFMVPWFSLYFIAKFGVNLGEVGIVFAVSQVGMAIAYLLIPKMVEKIGCVHTIVYSQWTAILSLLLISVSPNFAVASVLYMIRVTLMNMSSPAFSSFVMGLLKSEERASGNSIIWASWNIANALPRPAAGYIMKNIFLDMSLYICASLYSVSTIIFYTVFRKVEKKSNKP